MGRLGPTHRPWSAGSGGHSRPRDRPAKLSDGRKWSSRCGLPYVHPKLAAIAHRDINADGSPVHPVLNLIMHGQDSEPRALVETQPISLTSVTETSRLQSRRSTARGLKHCVAYERGRHIPTALAIPERPPMRSADQEHSSPHHSPQVSKNPHFTGVSGVLPDLTGIAGCCARAASGKIRVLRFRLMVKRGP
jgi:hypothetical protein